MDTLLLEQNFNKLLSDNVSVMKTKYSNYLENAERAYMESTGRKMPVHLQSALVKTLRNTDDFFVEKRNYFAEESTPGDINAFIHHAFDMVTAILPGSVIEEFATIQGMDKRIGEIFFMDIIKGTTKGAQTKGDNYLSSQYGPNTGAHYSDEVVELETYTTGNGTDVSFTGYPTWKPVKAGSMTITYTIAGVEYTASVSSTGTVSGTFIDGSSSFAPSTQLLTLVFTVGNPPDNATPVYLNYEYNSTADETVFNPAPYAYNGSSLPEVDIKVTSSIVEAKRRALKTKWLLDTAAMLSKEHGKDIEAELLDAVIAGVMNEIAVEAAGDIYTAANAGAEVQFSKTPPSTQIPYIVHRQELLGKIMEADTQIETAVRKVRANFVIGGADLINVVKGMPVDMFKPASYAEAVPVGMHVVGTLNGQYKIIQNFDFRHDLFVVGAKGNSWLLTGYVYAPFIPLMTTKPLTDENLNTFRSLLTYYGKKVVNSKFYNRGLILA